jgi:hypothetical protein
MFMLLSTMEKKDTDQLLLRPDRKLINRLRELAKEFQKPSGNQIALEVVTEYLDLWVQRETEDREARIARKETYNRIKQEMLKRPLMEIEPKSTTRPAAKRKRK